MYSACFEMLLIFLKKDFHNFINGIILSKGVCVFVYMCVCVCLCTCVCVCVCVCVLARERLFKSFKLKISDIMVAV
jgi:hypothetical protein